MNSTQQNLSAKFGAVLAAFALLIQTPAAQAQIFKNFSAGSKNIAPKPQSLEFREKWAILIGLTKYEDDKLQPIKSTTANLAVLSKSLQDPAIGRFTAERVQTIYGARATKQIVESALKDELYKKALPTDLIFIYLCGRAFYRDDDALFCTYDTNMNDLATAGISLKQTLTQLHRRTQCNNIICCLDIGSVLDQKWPVQFWQQLAQTSDVTVLSASVPGQPSYQSPFMGSSYFAHYLVAGFGAGGGTCTTEALAQLVQSSVATDVKRDLSREQYPQFQPAFDSRDLLASMPGSLGKVARNYHPMKFGHPMDNLALSRPDLMLGTQIHSRQPAARPAPPTDDEDDDSGSKEDVDFSAYITKMKKDIQSKWKPPRQIEQRKVTTIFSILKDGTITDISIVGSSDDQAVDKSALEALKAASPVDPLPPGAPKSVQLRYVFDWQVSHQ